MEMNKCKATIDTVYIYSIDKETGGPQSLHQLAYSLYKNGYHVEMVYLNGRHYVSRQKALYYDELRICHDDSDIDKPDNVIIVSEILTYKLRQFVQAVKIVWWLSLDYYKSSFLWESSKQRLKYRGLPEFLTVAECLYRLVFHNDVCLSSLRIKTEFNGIFNLYNSEYVRRYLINNNIDEKRMMYLCAPIDDAYFEKIDTGMKKKRITYNPAKIADKAFMDEFLRRVSIEMPETGIIAIEGMRRTEVYEVLKSSMIYVDFGLFPGPERIPRQAVALYNNVLTSKKGSASNNIDVPIDDRFKIEIKKDNLGYAVDMTKKMLGGYESYVKFFDAYRNKAKKQHDVFTEEAVHAIERAYEETSG